MLHKHVHKRDKLARSIQPIFYNYGLKTGGCKNSSTWKILNMLKSMWIFMVDNSLNAPFRSQKLFLLYNQNENIMLNCNTTTKT